MAPSATNTLTQYTSINLSEKSLKSGFVSKYGESYGKELTKHTLERRIEGINTDTCDAGDEDAFFVADMGDVYRQHLRWKLKLTRVKPHYGLLTVSDNQYPR